MAAPPTGTGLRFPLVADVGFSWTGGPAAVEHALRDLLLTEPGERVGRPDYGVGLRRFLFAPNTVTTRTLLRQAVTRAIEAWEPRVALDEVAVTAAPGAPTRLNIEIRYRLLDDPTPRSLHHPFHLDEGA